MRATVSGTRKLQKQVLVKALRKEGKTKSQKESHFVQTNQDQVKYRIRAFVIPYLYRISSSAIYYPPEVRREKYWGLGVFLLQYFPLVKI